MFKINFSLSRNSLTSARAAPSPSWATRCARRRRGRPTTRAASAAPAARPRSAASTSSWTEAPSCARRTTWPRGTSARGAAALSRGRCCRRWEDPSTRGASPAPGARQTWTGCSSTWRGRRRRIPYARSATQGILAKKLHYHIWHLKHVLRILCPATWPSAVTAANSRSWRTAWSARTRESTTTRHATPDEMAQEDVRKESYSTGKNILFHWCQYFLAFGRET